MESSVDSVSDQAQLSKLARSSQDTKVACIDMKCRKMELQLKLKCVCVQEHKRKLKHEEACKQRVADEWALLLKQQMQDKELAHKEKELAHKEWMIQHQLELARLTGQAPLAMGASHTPVGEQEDPFTNIYPSTVNNFSSDLFVFSTGATSSISASLPSTSWDSGVSALLL